MEKVFEEIMTKKFSNVMKTTNPQIQETQQNFNTRNMKKTTSRHRKIKSNQVGKKEKEKEISKSSQGWGKTRYMQRNKAKEDGRLRIRNSTSRETAEQHL